MLSQVLYAHVWTAGQKAYPDLLPTDSNIQSPTSMEYEYHVLDTSLDRLFVVWHSVFLPSASLIPVLLYSVSVQRAAFLGTNKYVRCFAPTKHLFLDEFP